MINNRQAGRRNRGRNNNNNGRPNTNNRGGGDNGNRIDNRARGNATQLLEKYRNMARDAQMVGDRVNAEYYLQFADHYFRVLADNRVRQEEQQQRFRPRDENGGDDDNGGDDFDNAEDNADDFRMDHAQYDRTPRDFGDRAPREQAERAPREYDRAPREQSDRAPRDNGQRDNGQGERVQRDNGNRDQRDNSQRDNSNRDNGSRAPRDDNRRYDEVRDDRTRRDRPRRDRPVADTTRAPQEAVDAMPVVESAPVAPTPQPEAEAARPRRGRPRKVDVAASDAPEGLDMAILPPSIARADNDSEPGEDAPKKRTRRAKPATEAAE